MSVEALSTTTVVPSDPAVNQLEPASSSSAPPSPLPRMRDSSPDPSSHSPDSTLLSGCPSLDRSFSTASTVSEGDVRSSTGSSRSSTGSTVAWNRRGYVRPQGARFAESARNRESVMNLGSIAHVQYYFARTGVLDGKGAQLARDDPTKTRRKTSATTIVADGRTPGPDTGPTTPLHDEMAHSPIDLGPGHGDWEDAFVLPPTVSTYNTRAKEVVPPPDMDVLRNELREALVYVSKAVDDVQRQQDAEPPPPPTDDGPDDPIAGDAGPRSPHRGMHEIQGTHILDVATLAIKAAREYYLMHAHPQLLAKVKSERHIREELHDVMDVLKRMAMRHFAGGLRPGEVFGIQDWVRKVEAFLDQEQAVAAQENRDRASWTWLDGDWRGRERRREWEFLTTFLEGEALPAWDDPHGQPPLPTPFLAALRNGLTLIHLHNRILQTSHRPFGRIDAYHTDFAVPYRAADNLRYWVKAAELRWEVKLQVDVLAVVYDKAPAAWMEFDAALLRWCRTLREEITRDWKHGAVHVSSEEQHPSGWSMSV